MNLDPYEYVSLVVPGSVVALVLTLLSPDVRDVIAKDGIDLGGFGVIVLVALVSGFLLQSIGNVVEALETKLGLNPSELLRKRGSGPVSAAQFQRISRLLKEKGLGDIAEMSASDWRAARGEMAAEVRAHDSNSRLDIMLRMYGLGRGLVSAFTLSIGLTLLFPDAGAIRWKYLAVLGIGLVLSYARTRRFSQNYLRELVIGYLRSSGTLKPIAQAEAASDD